ncbi:photosystem II reaction center protein PsbN [Halalkalibacter alkaliphilus]|uniref:Photosystem II reaction center protein PsbN n=2 Tax=Bacillaceae TaxID=186817 RepID=A0A9X2I8E1_9BACI|nr:photosystem II reaction center protein PsbN [Halalkalibacter alkaliphilus]MCL7748824.1 photosystem II reaction center protein PsbN [Halalkalibacter alkaliphilus]
MWRKLILLLIILISFQSNLLSYAETTDKKEKIAVILVPGLSMTEAHWFIHNEGTSELFEEAALGAMNVRPDGPYSYLNNMVTMGAGAKAVGVQGWNSYEATEEVKGFPASEWVHQLTGIRRTEGLLHPDFHRLNNKNELGTHRGQVGVFGDMLREEAIVRQVYGHSDTLEERIRYGSLLALDQSGTVNGDITQSVKEKSGSPNGMEMDIEFLINKLSTVGEKQKRFFVIEWGDLYRLYDQMFYMEESHFQNEQESQLKRLHSFLEQARQEVDELWVISPMMNKQAYDEKQQLAPVFYWGQQKGGYLTSNTTRQEYLLSSIDIVPTLLGSFHLPSESYSGNQVMQSSVGVMDKTPFFQTVDEIVLIYKSRASVLSIYITCLVVALIGAAIYGAFGTKKRRTWRYITRLILLSALWSPFWFLALSGTVKTLGISGFVLGLIASSLLCGYVVEKGSEKPIFWIGLFTFLLINVDIILGFTLMQRSYLGYDPIIGARYYGIGNEFAGVYIISAIMVISPLVESIPKKRLVALIVPLFTCVIVILGKNTLGTNAGATLSAGIAFAFFFYRMITKRWSWRFLLIIFALSLSALFLFLYMLQLTGEQTHIGMAFDRLLNGDIRYITDTIQRKMAMNMKIFRHSNWTQLFVTSYLLGAIILWRRRLQLEGRDKQLFLQTGVVASFALLLLNDSGVVAAATSMFCVVSAHYYWLSASKEENNFAVGKTINPSQTVED